MILSQFVFIKKQGQAMRFLDSATIDVFRFAPNFQLIANLILLPSSLKILSVVALIFLHKS